jgi:hypothetical protein
MTRHEQLERDLRAAAARFDSVEVSPDAWQEHLRRRQRRPARRLRWPDLTAVAAVLVLLYLVASALLSGSGRGDGLPAGGADDPWASQNILGEPEVVEQLTVDGTRTTHEIVLTDTNGKGPVLCERYTTADRSAGSGGCSARDPEADDPSVAVDWLTGTTGSGDGMHGVVAGVDARVAKVQIWMSNGDMVLARLHPTGWDDTSMFALTVQAGAPVPQRLVAYADATGTVLQAVDLADRFGDEWLPAGDCSGIAAGVEVPEADTRVGAHATVAYLDARGRPSRSLCLPLAGALQGVTAGPRAAVLVVAPEVTTVATGAGRATVSDPVALPGTVWRVVSVTSDTPLGRETGLVARDASGQQLARTTVAGLS